MTEMRRPAAPRRAATPAAETPDTRSAADLKATLTHAERTLRQSLGYASSLQADLEHLDALTAQLVADYKRIARTCQDADAKSTEAAEEIAAIEERLGLLQEIGRTAEEGRAALNALAGDVSHAAIAFEWQWRVMEAGVEEAVRLTGRVSALEARASQLAETDQPFPVAAMIAERLEQRTANASVELAKHAETIESQIGRIQGVTRDLERAGVNVTTVEQRLDELVRGRHPAALDLLHSLEQQTVDAAARLDNAGDALQSQQRRIEGLTEEVARMTASVASVAERLSEVVASREPDARAKVEALEQRTAAASTRVEQTTADLDAQLLYVETLRGRTENAATDVAAIEQRLNHLVDAGHNTARAAIESLEQQTAEMSAGISRASSGLQAELHRIDALSDGTARVTRALDAAAARLAQVEAGLKSATRLDEVVSGVEARVARLADADPLLGRTEAVIEQLEERLTTATSLLEEVTRRELTTRTRLLSVASHGLRLRVTPRWPLIAGSAAALILAAAGGVPFMQLQQRPPSADGQSTAPQVLSAALSPMVTLPPAVKEPPAINAARAKPKLKPAPAPQKKAANVEAPAARPAPKPEPAVFQGSLTIGSDPAGASVFVNQQYVGQTPLNLNELRAGSQVVRIERDGYRRWTASVRVPAKKRQQVQVKLEPIVSSQ